MRHTGTTDAVQPTYDTTIGQDTTDGTAVFRLMPRSPGPRRSPRSAATVFVLTDALDAYADGSFDERLLVWETGANAGVGYEVKCWTQATRTLTLWQSARLPALAGDKFRVSPRCRKRLIDDCRDKFCDPRQHPVRQRQCPKLSR